MANDIPRHALLPAPKEIVWGHFHSAEIEPASVRVSAGLVLISVIYSSALMQLDSRQECRLGHSAWQQCQSAPPQAITDLGKGTERQSIMLLYKHGRIIERAVR
ncbi:hypothetical protein AAC387_Pa12g0940 [Persea americana]